MTMNSGITFRMTVTSADGTISEGTCGEAAARRMLSTAMRRGYRTEATLQGGAVMVRDIRGGVVPRRHTVTLEPATPAGKITDTARRDLELIASRGASLLPNGRIKAGYIYGIPPAATAQLIARGLVTVAGDAVTISLAARLAMLAQDHRTETREPKGYVYPSDIGRGHLSAGLNKPGGRAGKVYDGSSVASCSCRGWSYPAGDRDTARRKAHEHRQQATATMLATFPGVAA
jgi:hypothetical protein